MTKVFLKKLKTLFLINISNWGFTRQEKLVILSLIFFFLLGAGIKIYKAHFITYPEKEFVQNFSVDSLRQEFIEKSKAMDAVPEQAPIGFAAIPAKININSDSVVELIKLPKVGPALAKRIIDYRQQNGDFKKITDIKKVKGIGPKIYQQIQPYIYVK
ncbi:ComEA family DNA-binding protein [candidate division KSB1 bacterium]|nr:ComEA family DNA-binding protein [candidate division KSB1 bacterium]